MAIAETVNRVFSGIFSGDLHNGDMLYTCCYLGTIAQDIKRI